MRILFWSPAFWPELGGVQFFGVQLIRGLRARGYEFCVVTRQYTRAMPTGASLDGIPIHRYPFRTALSSGRIEDVADVRHRILELKKSFDPDLIHLNGADPGTFFHLATANARSYPTLLTLHGLWPGETCDEDSMMLRTLQAVDWTTCCSEATLREVRFRVPEILDRSSVIHNARKTPTILPRPLPRSSPRLLCLGRLSREKGFDVAVKAFATIGLRFGGVRLVIAGDGSERESLEEQAKELGVSHRIDFLGWVDPDAVPELVNTASVVMVPSRWEGFGLAALEAALMGRPVVASNVGGLPEVVRDKVTGLLVSPEDSDALASAVEYLLAHPAAAQTMGSAGRRFVVNEFSWQDHVQAFDSLYRKVAGASHVNPTRPIYAPDNEHPGSA